jgi:hypothetical protein
MGTYVRGASGQPSAAFQRALKNGNLWVAEAEARDLQYDGLEDAYSSSACTRRRDRRSSSG